MNLEEIKKQLQEEIVRYEKAGETHFSNLWRAKLEGIELAEKEIARLNKILGEISDRHQELFLDRGYWRSEAKEVKQEVIREIESLFIPNTWDKQKRKVSDYIIKRDDWQSLKKRHLRNNQKMELIHGMSMSEQIEEFGKVIGEPAFEKKKRHGVDV